MGLLLMEGPTVKMSVPITAHFSKCLWANAGPFPPNTEGPLLLVLYSVPSHDGCGEGHFSPLEKEVGATWKGGEEEEGAQTAPHPLSSSVTP